MKNLFVALTAVAVLFIVGCQDNSNNPLSSSDTQALSKASAQGADNVAAPIDGRRDRRLEGRVNDVDPKAGTVTIGKLIVLTDKGTKIERNGLEATLEEFQVGDRGQVRWDARTGVVSKVEATSIWN